MSFFTAATKSLAISALAMTISACGDSGTSAENSDSPENSIKDSRDGQVYPTVTIGTQTWMAKNLNYDYNVGSATSSCYNNSADNCAKYGRLYTWSAAMDSAAVFTTNGAGCGHEVTCNTTEIVRGICPEGFHLPNNNDWNTLFNFINDPNSKDTFSGKILKSKTDWENSGNGTDDYGFSAKPAGAQRSNKSFDYLGQRTYIWSSTEDNPNGAYIVDFSYKRDFGGLDKPYDFSKSFSFSIRCVKD